MPPLAIESCLANALTRANARGTINHVIERPHHLEIGQRSAIARSDGPTNNLFGLVGCWLWVEVCLGGCVCAI